MGISISVRVTAPKEIIAIPRVQSEIIKAMLNKTLPSMEKYFGWTVRGWDNPPDWESKLSNDQSSISISVWAAGKNAQQYAWVNNGTDPHPIPPRNPGGFLIFQPGYHAGTRPHALGSEHFTRFGDFVTAKGVNHPGIKNPRQFDQAVADAIDATFKMDMQEAIARGAHDHA